MTIERERMQVAAKKAAIILGASTVGAVVASYGFYTLHNPWGYGFSLLTAAAVVVLGIIFFVALTDALDF